MTEEVSKLLRSNDTKERHSLNISSILSTFEVSKLLISRVSKSQHSKNI